MNTFHITFSVHDNKLGIWVLACRSVKAKDSEYACNQIYARYRQNWGHKKRLTDARILDVTRK